MRKQILKNLFSNYAGTFIGMALGFFLVPFLVYTLGKEGYGLTILAESLIGFLQIFIFSVRVAISRYATISTSQGKNAEFIEYLSTGHKILSVFMIWVLVAGLVITYFFPKIFNVPAEFHSQTQILFLFILIAFVISIPNIIYWSVLYAQQRFDLITVSNFGGVIFRAVAIFLLFSLQPRFANLVSYGVIYLLMTWGQNYCVYRWAKKIRPDLDIKNGRFHKDKAKEIVSYGGYSSFGRISTVIYENGMNIIINIYMGPEANAVYAVAMKIPATIKRLILEPSWSLVPSFVNLASIGNKDKLERFFIMYSKGVSMVLVPLSLLLIIFSREFINLWVGRGFEQAAPVMAILVIGVALSMFSYFCSTMIGGYGAIRIPTIVGLILAVVNLFLGAILGLRLHWGLEGIAIAALIINVIGSMLFIPTYTCKIAGISLFKFWREALLKPLFLTAILFGGVLTLRDHLNFLSMSVGLMAAVVIYAMLAYRFMFNAEEKINIKDALREFFIKASRA